MSKEIVRTVDDYERLLNALSEDRPCLDHDGLGGQVARMRAHWSHEERVAFGYWYIERAIKEGWLIYDLGFK